MISRLTAHSVGYACGVSGLAVGTVALVSQTVGLVLALAALICCGAALARVIGRHHTLEAREAFRHEIERALAVASDEDAASAIAGRALGAVSPGAQGELLLTDADREHLDRVAAAPAGAAACSVARLQDCVAIRQGGAHLAATSTAISACPNLDGRPAGACSAVCVPVGFAGVPLGVLHLTGADGIAPGREIVERAVLLADRLGLRLGTLRIAGTATSRAANDPLTGLLDRHGLEEAIRMLARAGRHFSVAIADIDHLRDINEAFGHDEGDHAIVLFGSVLRSVLRGDDLLARFAGEEFALVFPETGSDDAAKLLERIQFALGGALATGEAPHFTVSFGVSDTVRSDGVDGAIADAEAALALAKAHGRNRIVVARRDG